MRISLFFLLVLTLAVPLSAQPSVVSDANTFKGSGSTTTTLNLPATVNAGETLVAFLSSGSSATHSGWSAGWVELVDVNGMVVAYKKADGTEDSGTETINLSVSTTSLGWVGAIAGAEDPTTQAPEKNQTGSGSSVSCDPPSLSPTGGSKTYLWFAFGRISGCPSISATPSSYTEERSTCTGDVRGWAGTRQTTAASEDPSTFTWGSSGTVECATVAVHPSSASGPFPTPQHNRRRRQE